MLYEVITREYICPHVPTVMCHGSSVLPLADGSVLAAWFGGSHEGEADTAIWLSRRSADTGMWTTPSPVQDALPEAHWNPVLSHNLLGEIILYYKVGAQISTWRTYACVSRDKGQSWSAPRELVPGDLGGRGPVRNKLVRLMSGRLLAPASLEHGEWTAFADISDDDGRSWHKSEPIRITPSLLAAPAQTAASYDIPVSEQSFHGRGIIQPSIWEDDFGIHMLLRSTEGTVFRSDSVDQGLHWSHATSISLPNNNSGLDLARLDNGMLILACNPVAANWGVRTPLSLLASTDNGASWTKLLDLDSGRGEFAYPAIVAVGSRVHVTYTWKRQTIAYWLLEFDV